MYVPRDFRIDDADALELAEAVGVGHLITAVDGTIESSFVPFLLERRDDSVIVRAHLAVGNTHRRAIGAGADSLMIVTGPDTYVSPNWYPSKAEHGKVVPTWNYSLVHLRGNARLIDDRQALRDLVSALTDRHEASQSRPWSVTDAPPDYLEAQLKAIVGVELTITSVEGKAKLSQNREPRDRQGVQQALSIGSAQQRSVARSMGLLNDFGG